MHGTVRRADNAKRSLYKRENFLHAMPHVLAGGREEIHATLRKFRGPGLRAIAAIADHDPVGHPTREGPQQFTIIDGRGGQIKPAAPSGLITLHVELKAVPPPHAVLGVARPVPRDAMLARPGNVTHSQRCGILQDNRIRPLGLVVAMQHQDQHGPPLHTIAIRRLDKFTVVVPEKVR